MREVLQLIKKYRLWLIALIVIGAVCYSLWHRFTRPQVTPTPSPSTIRFSPSPQRSPLASPSPSPSSQAELIESGPTLFADYDQLSQTFYYFDFTDSSFKKRALTANEPTTLAKGSSFINAVLWAPDHTRAIIKLENGQGNIIENPFFQANVPYGETVIGLYTFASGQFQALNQHITAVSFIDSSHILYQYQKGKDNNLSIASPDGSGWRNLEKLQGTVEISRASQTALVKSGDRVTRYQATGKSSESFRVPGELKLSQSAWFETTARAIYWTDKDGAIQFNEFSGTSKTLSLTTPASDEFTILWDNKSGDIYAAGFNGLQKIGNSKP